MTAGQRKWLGIRRHLTTNHTRFYDRTLATVITPQSKIYISKTSNKFRLKSYLDWAWYSPRTLAQAIDRDDLEVYYTQQLSHNNSDPNVWNCWDEEQTLKSYYAARAGRGSII